MPPIKPYYNFSSPFFNRPGPPYSGGRAQGTGGVYAVRNNPATRQRKNATTSNPNTAKGGGLMGEDFMQFAGAFGEAIGRAMSYQQPQVEPYAPALATGVRPEITQMAAERQTAAESINVQRERQAMQDRIAQQQMGMQQQELQAEREGREFQRNVTAERLERERELFPEQLAQARARTDAASRQNLMESILFDDSLDAAQKELKLKAAMSGARIPYAKDVAGGEAAAGRKAMTEADILSTTKPDIVEQTGQKTELGRLDIERTKAEQPHWVANAANKASQIKDNAKRAAVETFIAEETKDFTVEASKVRTEMLLEDAIRYPEMSDAQLKQALSAVQYGEIRNKQLQWDYDHAETREERAVLAQKLNNQQAVMNMSGQILRAENEAKRLGMYEQSMKLNMMGKLTDAASTNTTLPEDVILGVAANTWANDNGMKLKFGGRETGTSKTAVKSGKDLYQQVHNALLQRGDNTAIADFEASVNELRGYNAGHGDEGTLIRYVGALSQDPSIKDSGLQMPSIPPELYEQVGLTPPPEAPPFVPGRDTPSRAAQVSPIPERGGTGGAVLPPNAYPEATPEAIGNSEYVEINGNDYYVIGEKLQREDRPDYVNAGEADPARIRYNNTIEELKPVIEFSGKGVPKTLEYKTAFGKYVTVKDSKTIDRFIRSGPAGLSVIISTPAVQSLFGGGAMTPQEIAPGVWVSDMPKTRQQVAAETAAERQEDRATKASRAQERAASRSGRPGATVQQRFPGAGSRAQTPLSRLNEKYPWPAPLDFLNR